MSQTIPAGQLIRSDDDHEWWFDSGAVTLDFAYTGAMSDDPARETLNSPTDLGAWLHARYPAVDAEPTGRDLIDARALRLAIAASATAISRDAELNSSDVDIINLFAATPDIPPTLAGGTRQAGRTGARIGQALSAMAREAVRLFAPETHDRIRECAAEDCSLVFYDESRSNNRRWCSMQRCGNRAKVRAHRARR